MYLLLQSVADGRWRDGDGLIFYALCRYGSESDLLGFGTYLVLPMMIDEAPRVISKSPFIKDSHG